jgi:hypothetical protein
MNEIDQISYLPTQNPKSKIQNPKWDKADNCCLGYNPETDLI